MMNSESKQCHNMQSDNLATWKRFDRPPKEALKTIKGGRLSGMTDISPQWRMKAMTEVFGPCGQGWWYTVDSFDRQDMAGEIALLARITLHVKGLEHPIPGLGASMLCAQERNGLRLNDEAWKMAVTDALSVAMKALGVGAEVYLGNWDGSKYRNAAQDNDRQNGGSAKLTDSQVAEWIADLESASTPEERSAVYKAAIKTCKDAHDPEAGRRITNAAMKLSSRNVAAGVSK